MRGRDPTNNKNERSGERALNQHNRTILVTQESHLQSRGVRTLGLTPQCSTPHGRDLSK